MRNASSGSRNSSGQRNQYANGERRAERMENVFRTDVQRCRSEWGPGRNRMHRVGPRPFSRVAREQPDSADTLPIRSPIVDIIEPSRIPLERYSEFQVPGQGPRSYQNSRAFFISAR